VSIRLEVDGVSAVQDIVFGSLNESLSQSPKSKVVPITMTANPDRFDPAVLPREFGIYAWYVADAEELSAEDLDIETVEALRGLGYLD
jgi:hypothetical protein